MACARVFCNKGASMTEKTVFLFYDFVSPFTYLQSKRIEEFGDMKLKPVLFAGLLNNWGPKGPAETAAQRKPAS